MQLSALIVITKENIFMEILTEYPLKKLNTFGIAAKAGHFASFSSENMLTELLSDTRFRQPELILGGGSNILLTRNPVSVLKNEIKGIEKIDEDAEHIYIKAGAGENWHSFVQHCIRQQWAGVENLSLIPGNVGASPMQNIGAYGVEIKDVFHSLEAYHIQDKKVVTFKTKDCRFGYRESIFKNKRKGEFVILNVSYRLNKKPDFNTSYGAIEKELEDMGVEELSIRAVSEAVIRIRSAKLPDPAKVGNAGSFFKNPIVSEAKKEELAKAFPRIKYYPFDDKYKLAAGWLIDKCGWKGYRKGSVGIHPLQALVLVNYDGAEGKDVQQLAAQIKESVAERFGVILESEVNIV